MSINFPPNLGKGQNPQDEPPLNIPGIDHLNFAQEQTVKNLLNIAGMDIKNRAEQSDIEKRFAPEGDFTKVLHDVGITDPKEISAILKYVKEKTGYESPEAGLVCSTF